jgi:hypothetical protein
VYYKNDTEFYQNVTKRAVFLIPLIYIFHIYRKSITEETICFKVAYNNLIVPSHMRITYTCRYILKRVGTSHSTFFVDLRANTQKKK